MKFASDFRRSAREALKNKWGVAVVGGLLASLLGGTIDSGGSFSFNYRTTGSSEEMSSTITGFTDMDGKTLAIILSIVGVILIITIAVALAFSVLSSVVSVGYSRFNLELIDGNESRVDQIFSYFGSWKTIFVANLLRSIYITLWSLLFIIPGVIASYSYIMVPYVLAENPSLTAREALAKSAEIMRGNRWRLFCLMFSFIGWDLLCILSLGIGFLWITPYENAAVADFYREVSGTRHEFNTEEGTFDNPEVI